MAGEALYFETRDYRVAEYRQGLAGDMYIRLCGIENCHSGSSTGPVKRKGWHLHFVVSGKGRMMVDGRKIDIHEGQLFLTVPEKEVWYQADEEDPWRYCWITYDGQQVQKYMEYAGFVNGIYVVNCKIESGRFLEAVQYILDKPEMDTSSCLYRLGYAYLYMSLAVEANEKNKRADVRALDFTTDDYVNYAIRYIEDNYAHVKIQDVAKYLGINRTYLSMIFRKKMCVSPQEFLMHIKMNKGRELLMETNFSVHAVSKCVGYENQLTFSKMFKKEYGLSPDNFRKKYEKTYQELNRRVKSDSETDGPDRNRRSE